MSPDPQWERPEVDEPWIGRDTWNKWYLETSES